MHAFIWNWKVRTKALKNWKFLGYKKNKVFLRMQEFFIIPQKKFPLSVIFGNFFKNYLVCGNCDFFGSSYICLEFEKSSIRCSRRGKIPGISELSQYLDWRGYSFNPFFGFSSNSPISKPPELMSSTDNPISVSLAIPIIAELVCSQNTAWPAKYFLSLPGV